MSDDRRPDPDALLASLQADEAKAKRGRLRIFFGMCPGVGKTYAMLKAARQKMNEGVEVVVGVVETHQRPETMALVEGMPIVPRAKIEHRGATLEEMDAEAILLWHPRLALVDELAHTNAPGSRHPKRYQDVIELLNAGIDVFTTLNVQHVESRNDAVRQFTGVTVRETVPDSVLDLADEIELIDLSPEQLRQRLSEGKVYLGERAATAAENFFREENLSALREMSLRLTAEHVDRRLRTMRPIARESWRAGDRLMVAVSASPHSAELIRWTRRYAAALEAPWIAVAVELPDPLPPADEQRRSANLTLARQLGAEVILTAGTHIGEALLRSAKDHGATLLILGKPVGRAWRWQARSPIVWLIEHSGRIDVQLVRTDRQSDAGSDTPRAQAAPSFVQYGIALAIAAFVTIFGLFIKSWSGYWSIALLYLLSVTIGGTMLRRGPTLLLAGVSAGLWDFLFIPPLYTFAIHEPHDALMFAMFFVVAVVVGQLTSRLQLRERLESRREQRSTALYKLTRSLAASKSRDEAAEIAIRQIGTVFGLRSAALLRDESGIFSGAAHPASNWQLPAKEEGVAAWALQNKRAAGHGTDALPDSAALHLPLLVGEQVEGVLAVELAGRAPLSPEQRELLEAFASQLGVIAEKERLAAVQRKAEVSAASDRLQKTLFDSVSHELKTPISAIAAALDGSSLDREEIRRANDRLRRTVEHLLDATRLESGMLKPTMEWCEPSELAVDAMERAGLTVQAVHFDFAKDLPPIRVDAGLVSQALATLLHNASTHGVSHDPAILSIRRDGDFVNFEVTDRGRGLPADAEEKVFAKFYRGPGVPAGGVGLGLAIARGLAEALGGTLSGRNRPGGGACFTLRLPIGGELHLPA